MTTKIVFPPEWGYRLLESIENVVSEAILEISPTETKLCAFDLSHIMLVLIRLPKDVFSAYECTKPVKIGLNFADVKKIAQQLKKLKEPLEVEVLEKDKKTVFKAKKAKLSLTMLDIEEQGMDLKGILAMADDSEASIFTLNGATILDALNIAEIYGETMTFKSANEKLAFSTIGNVGDMEYEVESDDYAETPKWGDKSENIFANSFLKHCVKFIELGDKTVGKITLKAEAPLIIRIILAEKGEIFLALAPRVEEDDANLEE